MKNHKDDTNSQMNYSDRIIASLEDFIAEFDEYPSHDDNNASTGSGYTNDYWAIAVNNSNNLRQLKNSVNYNHSGQDVYVDK